MATNVTAAWSTGPIRWRNIAKSEAEDRMWLDQTLAAEWFRTITSSAAKQAWARTIACWSRSVSISTGPQNTLLSPV